MTKNELIEYSLTFAGAGADSPFTEDFETVVLRHNDTGKWFGLIMRLNDGDAVNLKSEPLNSDFLRGVYKGVTPAYHMNKVHWNTVYLDSDVPDDEIKNMVSQSFALTAKRLKKRKGLQNERK